MKFRNKINSLEKIVSKLVSDNETIKLKLREQKVEKFVKKLRMGLQDLNNYYKMGPK